MKIIRIITISATIFFLAILFAGFVSEGVTGHVSRHLNIDSGAFAIGFLFLLFPLNIWLSISSKQRTIHILLVVLIIALFPISTLCAKWRMNTLRKKFLNVELPVYESIVSNINQSAMGPTGEFYPLTKIGQLHISSKTNGDGSSTIFFFDAKDWIHGGYMYYNGRQLIPRKDHPNEYGFTNNLDRGGFFHITNDWYDFYK